MNGAGYSGLAVEMIAAGVVIGVLVLVIIYQAVLFHVERRRLAGENSELLNRLMARDFSEYALGTRAIESNRRTITEYLRSRLAAEKKPKEEPKGEEDGLGMSVV